MKPIKFLLSLCAVLMVAVGAMAQITSISAPTGVPASVCGGSTITLATAPTIVENPAGSCVGQALQLVAINLADNSDLATGSAGTVGSPTGGTLTLPATASPSTANIALRYRVTGGVCTFNAGTLSSNIAWTNNTLTAPTVSNVSPSTVCEGDPITIQGNCAGGGTFTIYTSATGSTTVTSPVTAVVGYQYYGACVDGACVSTRTLFPSATVNPRSLPSGQLNLVQSCAGVAPTFSGYTCTGTGSTLILVDATTGANVSALTGPALIAYFSSSTTHQLGGGCLSSTGCITPIANLVNVQPYTATAIPGAPGSVGISKVGGTPSSTTPKAVTVCAAAPLQFYGTCDPGSQLKIMDGTTAVLQGSAAPATGTKTYTLSCITPNGCESPAPSTASDAQVVVTIEAAPTAPSATSFFVASTVCQGAQAALTAPRGGCATTETLKIYTSLTGTETTTFKDQFGASTGAGKMNDIGAFKYYATCTSAAGCESSPRTEVVLTVNGSLPSGQLNLVQSCAGVAPTFSGYTCTGTGSTLILVDATTGANVSALTGPALIAYFSSSTTHQLGGGCLSSTGCITPIANLVNVQPYTATAIPGAPGSVGISKVGGTPSSTTPKAATVCAAAPLQFYGTCDPGSQLKIMDGTTMVLQGSAAPATGTKTYTLSCITPNGCESPAPSTASDAQVVVTIEAAPAPPTVTLSTPVCKGGQVSVTSNNCVGTLKFYTSMTGSETTTFKDQAGVGTNPTAGAMPNAGTFSFYATCTSALGCEGARSSAITVTVNDTPSAPTFTTAAPLQPSVVCANTSVGAPLQNSLTCSSSSQLLIWYKDGVQVSQPNVQPSATTTWKVVCKDASCESAGTMVTFTVNPNGTNPTSASLTAAGTTINAGANASICSAAASTAITFTGCPSGETLWYSVNGGDYVNSTVTPASQATGTTAAYRVKCKLGDCLSQLESSAMTLTINAQPSFKPVVTLTPATVCATAPASTPFGGSSNCGTFATVWFEVTVGGDVQLASLPATIPATAKTYYAKCKNAADCYSEKSDNVTFNIIPNATAPTITSIGGTEVCTGVNVTLTTNCPSGSTVMWSTGATGNALALVSAVPQVRAVTAKCVTTVGSTTCESPVSATTTVVWKTFDITIINIGSPLSGVKPGSNVPKSAWAANFVTVDAGPSLQSSSQGNPSVFFTENPNKGADRFWTVHVESCALGTTGAISYDMLVTPEAGVPYSYNTVENNAPYLMYANRDGFTELYAHNHGAYGFTSEPKYTQGLPKGLYKLSIRYWSEKGMGLYPAVRTAQGAQLAYQEYWFRIQSQNGIGSGAAREGVTENTEAPFVTMGQNPVTRTLSLTINGAKGQDVKLNLVDASGRSIKVSSVTPETNTHREEIDMTSQNTGMYFIQVSTPSKRAALKVLKVSQD